jgi:predicted transcriptional regulator YdeE
MKWDLKEREEFKIIGIAIQTDVFKCKKDAFTLWGHFMRRFSEIKDIKDPNVCYGLSLVNGECSFKHIACVEVKKTDNIPRGMVSEIVPKSKYAVFEYKGLISQIGKMYADLYENIIPNSGLKQKKFWFERYDPRFKKESKDSVMEIWIAVE